MTTEPSGSWIGTLTVAVGMLACAVYLPALSAQFTFDDQYIIVDNPVVAGEGGLKAIFTRHYWAAEDSAGSLYRPLAILSYRINFLLAGLDPWSYHLVNLVLHGLVTATLLHLALRLTGSLATAGAAALLFATHPVHSEAVVSAVGRAELMAALFVTAAWLWRDRTLVSLALFVCGLLSKENAVVLPALLVVEDLARGRGRASLRACVPWLAVALAFVAGRLFMLDPGLGDPRGPFADASALHRTLTAFDVLGRYLWLMLWPVRLSADYSFDQIPIVTSVLDPGALAGAAGAALALAGGWLARRRMAAIWTGVLTFFAALAPVSNLIAGIGVVMAERLLYLPSAGFCLAGGALLAGLARWFAGERRPAFAAACALAAIPSSLYAARAWVRANEWLTPLTLFEATARTSPRSAMAHFGLGSAHQQLSSFHKAEAAYKASIAIAPSRPGTWFNLGTMYEQAGRLEDALAAYEEAVRLDPEYQEALNNLGILHQAASRPAEAEKAYRRAVAAGPARAAPTFNLATVLEETGRVEEAIEWYRRTVETTPDHLRALNNLGRLLIVSGRPGEAIPPLEAAAAIDPAAPLPRVNLAAALLRTGDLARAEEVALEALRMAPDSVAARELVDEIRGTNAP